MESFTILNYEEMCSKLACIGNVNVGAVIPYSLFNEGITKSLQEVHQRRAKVNTSDRLAGLPRNGPTNSWYNVDCTNLRKQWKYLQRETGIDDHDT